MKSKSKSSWSDRAVYGKGDKVEYRGKIWAIRDRELRGKNSYYMLAARGNTAWVRGNNVLSV